MVNTCGEAIAAVKFTRNVSVVILKSNRINSGYSKNLTDKLQDEITIMSQDSDAL